MMTSYMLSFVSAWLLASAVCVKVCLAEQYSVPATAPISSRTILNSAPVGVSIEFFAFPGYTQLSGTYSCLSRLREASGEYPAVRIGGTTQDRALYDRHLSTAVNYTVSNPSEAPASLTYGKEYFKLAAQYAGNVTIGLNRRLAKFHNTARAAKLAHELVPTLLAVELGNEPDFYGGSDPIVVSSGGSWNPSVDAANQVDWQQKLAHYFHRSKLPNTSLVQAGVRLELSSGWSVAQLGPDESASGISDYIRSFGEHSYPQSACGGSPTNLQELMSHSDIVSYVSMYENDVAVAHGLGKPYLLSETNSATCGGGGISSTFGAGLWILDYVLQSTLLGIAGLNFHQGTIGACSYCWWGQNITFAPYYGAYAASVALANMSKIIALDYGQTDYAVYALYDQENQLQRCVLYNSDYYLTGSPNRTSETFVLTGLPSNARRAVVQRLTAEGADAKVEYGVNPNFAGQTFDNNTCDLLGSYTPETLHVKSHTVSVQVSQSEAVIVDFQ